MLSKTIDPDKVDIRLTNLQLHVGVAQLTEPIWQHVGAQLKEHPAIIETRKVICRDYPIPSNSSDVRLDLEVFPKGSSPVRLVLCLVESKAYFGKLDKNPYS